MYIDRCKKMPALGFKEGNDMFRSSVSYTYLGNDCTSAIYIGTSELQENGQEWTIPTESSHYSTYSQVETLTTKKLIELRMVTPTTTAEMNTDGYNGIWV